MGSSKRRQRQRRRKGPTPSKRRVGPVRGVSSTTPSHRYTPPAKNRGLFRPLWHKLIGGLLVVLGLGIFVINDLEWFGIRLMPGGHNEIYALLGIVIAASSLWWFGWLDRSPTRW